MNLVRRRAAVAAITTLALLGLSACGSDEPEAPETAETTEAEPTDEAPVASGDQPEWAKPVTEPGEKITSFKVGDVNVDVYQVGITKATKTGQFVDPKENKPIIAEGDDIVFVNYVITNNGDPIDLGSSLVSISARYDDWPYLQGMDSIVDRELYEAQDVNADALATGAFRDPSVYTFGSGQTFSFGENFRYQKDSPIEFKATIVPVDADGKLIHDDRLEGAGKATIK